MGNPTLCVSLETPLNHYSHRQVMLFNRDPVFVCLALEA